jgi:uncharacterized protein YndB with AHSA1/START domain
MAPSNNVEVVIDGPNWLVVEMAVPAVEATDLLGWFTDAVQLNRWWGEEAMIEPRPGGLFLVHWPPMDLTLRGTVGLVTDDTFMWSWTWDHEPDRSARAVVVQALAEREGSMLRITHGPYRPDGPLAADDTADRDSHRDGWLFFLPALLEAIEADRVGAVS